MMHRAMYNIAGIFRGELRFVFFTIERISKSLLCMHVHSAGAHLRCANNKSANKFRNTQLIT